MLIEHEPAMRFMERWHYSQGCSRTSVFAYGLFKVGEPFYEENLLGASVWLPPTKNAAKTVSDDWRKVLSLTRLAIKPEVPTNGCSFLLAKSRKKIKKYKHWHTLLTFADTFQNHTGNIYRADNWRYLGLTKPSPVWANKEGKIMGAKRASVNLTKAEMYNLGFTLLGNFPKHKFVYYL